MPCRSALLLLLVNVGVAVHAATTGRFSSWGWIIIVLPPLGSIAYILAELLPNLLGSPRGERTRRAIAHSVNPEKTYRALRDQLAEATRSPTGRASPRNARRSASGGRPGEQYDEIVRRPNGGEPVFHVARAEAGLELGRPAEALASLDALKVREPDYDSPRGHMLYARALAAVGRTDEAIDAFETISRHDHAYEARARLAAVLAEAGRRDEARRDAQEILDSLRRAPAHVRTLQAEWGRLAENVLRRT